MRRFRVKRLKQLASPFREWRRLAHELPAKREKIALFFQRFAQRKVCRSGCPRRAA